jgi:hypothetical protein
MTIFPDTGFTFLDLGGVVRPSGAHWGIDDMGPASVRQLLDTGLSAHRGLLADARVLRAGFFAMDGEAG